MACALVGVFDSGGGMDVDISENCANSCLQHQWPTLINCFNLNVKSENYRVLISI